MEHKTILTTWVTIDTVAHMESVARKRNITVSELTREVLTTFVYGKPVPLAEVLRGNRDGQDEDARSIIKANTDCTISRLMHLLSNAGITRKKTWITDARLVVRAENKRNTE